MLSTILTPNQKIFLHIVAAMAIVAAVWRIWSMVTTRDHHLLYLPVIVLWFVYYVICLRRIAHSGQELPSA